MITTFPRPSLGFSLFIYKMKMKTLNLIMEIEVAADMLETWEQSA